MTSCPRCGHANDTGARFCNRCGDYIEQVPASAPPTADAVLAAPRREPAPAKVYPDQPPARKPELGPVGPRQSAPVSPPLSSPTPSAQPTAPVAVTAPFDSAAPSPANALLDRLRGEDAERLVPRLVAGSVVVSILALIAASLIVLAGGAAQTGSVAVSAPTPSRAPSSVAAVTLLPSAVPGNGGSSSSGGGSPGQPGVVGIEGIDAWDALDAAEKTRVTTVQSFFLHQSVGGDLEDGAQAVGFRFGYADSSSTNLDPGLNGGTFFSSNGNPSGKIAEFRSIALANLATVKVAIMKFGYADILEDTVADVQTAYQTAVSDIKAQGIRVLHVTPPFVYDAPAENAPKMQMRAWMMVTFPDDVIFDLEDVESLDPTTGTRCEREGSWEICDSVRSTVGCQSQNQGIDSAQGQGHLCFDPHAQRFAKAFLYAIYLAGR